MRRNALMQIDMVARSPCFVLIPHGAPSAVFHMRFFALCRLD